MQSLEFTSYYDWKKKQQRCVCMNMCAYICILQDGRPRTFTMYGWWCARVLVVGFFLFISSFLLFLSLKHTLNSLSLLLSVVIICMFVRSSAHSDTCTIFKIGVSSYWRRGRTRKKSTTSEENGAFNERKEHVSLSLSVNVCMYVCSVCAGLKIYTFRCMCMCMCVSMCCCMHWYSTVALCVCSVH